MIPIKNKKKNLEATVEEMRNFSFAYIEKYAPSKQQVKTYLLKKYLKVNIPTINKSNITDLINVVLEDLEKTKFINDKFYASLKAKSLIQRGSSINKIRHYLNMNIALQALTKISFDNFFVSFYFFRSSLK